MQIKTWRFYGRADFVVFTERISIIIGYCQLITETLFWFSLHDIQCIKEKFPNKNKYLKQETSNYGSYKIMQIFQLLKYALPKFMNGIEIKINSGVAKSPVFRGRLSHFWWNSALQILYKNSLAKIPFI